MQSKSYHSTPEVFSAEFSVALSKLLTNKSQQNIIRALNKLRSEHYQRFVDKVSGLPDGQFALLQCYELTELLTVDVEHALIEAYCTEAFDSNASKCLRQAFSSEGNTTGDINTNIQFYKSFKGWMVAVDEFRNVLNQIHFYVEDVSAQVLKEVQTRSEKQLSYSLKFKDIIYILFLKMLRMILRAAKSVAEHEAFKEVLKGLLVIAFAIVFGTDQAKLATKVQRSVAVLILPMFSVMEIVNPFGLDNKLDGIINTKKANLHVKRMKEEVDKSAMFFEGGAKKLRQLLNDYAKIYVKSNGETQQALDKKIMMIRLLTALSNGEDFNTETLEDFIKNSTVKFKELGGGWQEVEAEDEEEERSEVGKSKFGK